jgi:hypothetical protein
VPGPLSDSSSTDLEKTLSKAVEVIGGYLEFFREIAPYHWDLGNIKNAKTAQIGYLATNEGIRALFRVLKELLTHIETQTGIDIDTFSSEELLSNLKKLVTPVAELFHTANFETIAQFRSRSGQKGIRSNSIHMQGFIHHQFPEFNPPGLQDYLDSLDEEGTKEANNLIDELQLRMFRYVIYKLKEKYPDEKDWWYEGIPGKVRQNCITRCDAEKGVKEPEQYLTTIDYHSIAWANWKGCFEEAFSLSSDGGKEKKLAWIKKLNSIRNITHHAEKWPATKEQVEFVRKIHATVLERFVIPE